MVELNAATLRADGQIMARRYNDREYTALGAWTSRDEARAVAASLRTSGQYARITQERRPRRVRKQRGFMWIVWAVSQGEDAVVLPEPDPAPEEVTP